MSGVVFISTITSPSPLAGPTLPAMTCYLLTLQLEPLRTFVARLGEEPDFQDARLLAAKITRPTASKRTLRSPRICTSGMRSALRPLACARRSASIEAVA